MEIYDVLNEIGLTTAEAKIYVALLKTGSSRAGNIIRESALQSSVVYNGITSLINMGLIVYTDKGKKKIFTAVDPAHLEDIIEDKKRAVTEIIPKLNAIAGLSRQRQDVFVLDGKEGTKRVLNDILRTLKKGDEQFVMGVSVTHSGLGTFIRDWDKKRVKMNINKKVIVPKDEEEWARYYKNQPLTSVRLSKELHNMNLTINIYGDKTAIILWGNTPVSVVMERKGITDNFRRYFNAIWNAGKKPN